MWRTAVTEKTRWRTFSVNRTLETHVQAFCQMMSLEVRGVPGLTQNM